MAINNVGLEIKVKVDASSIQKLQESLKSTKQRFKETSDTTKQFTEESKKSEKTVKLQTTALEKLQQKQLKWNHEEEKSIALIKKELNEKRKLIKQELDTRTRFQKFKDSKFGALGVAVAGGISVKKILSDAMDFDKIGRKIQGVTHATNEDITTLNNAIFSTAKNYGFSTQELQHQAFSLSTVWNHGTKKTTENLEGIAMAALATSSSLETTANVYQKLEGTFQGMKGATLTMEQLTNATTFLRDVSGSTMEEMDMASTTAFLAAKAHNIELKDSVALLTALSVAGVRGSNAGTGFKQIASALTNPKIEKNLNKIGLTFKDVNLEKVDVATSVENLAKGIQQAKNKKGGDLLVQGLLREMFGESADKIKLLVEDPEKLKGFLKQQLTFKASKIANKQMEGTSAQFGKLTETISQVGLKLGIFATPALSAIFTGILDGFNLISTIGDKIYGVFDSFGFKIDKEGSLLASVINIISNTLKGAGIGAILGGIMGMALGPAGFALGMKAGALIGGGLAGAGTVSQEMTNSENLVQQQNESYLAEKFANNPKYEGKSVNVLADALNQAGMNTSGAELMSAISPKMSVKPASSMQNNNTNVNLVIEDKAGVKVAVKNVSSSLGGQTKITEKPSLAPFNPENY